MRLCRAGCGIRVTPPIGTAGYLTVCTAAVGSRHQLQPGPDVAVVLARRDAAADALTGAPLAARVHGPLLLTDAHSLNDSTTAEISRVLGGESTNKTVYILGGDGSVSPAIASKETNGSA